MSSPRKFTNHNYVAGLDLIDRTSNFTKSKGTLEHLVGSSTTLPKSAWWPKALGRSSGLFEIPRYIGPTNSVLRTTRMTLGSWPRPLLGDTVVVLSSSELCLCSLYEFGWMCDTSVWEACLDVLRTNWVAACCQLQTSRPISLVWVTDRRGYHQMMFCFRCQHLYMQF